MSLLFAKLNSPWDSIELGRSMDGHRLKMCFFMITFNSTSVQGVTGTTYDPTNHYTTHLKLAESAGKDLYSLWGLQQVHLMMFSNGSSDANITTAAANTNTGECKAEFVPSGNYIKLKVIGTGTDATKGYTVDEAEIDTTAGSLSALRLVGFLIGS